MAGEIQMQRPLLGLVAAVLIVIAAATAPSFASAQLSVSFYANTCPSVFDTVRVGVRSAINREARMGASLIRLFFHDCFVNGCDGSVLLEATGSFVSERSARGNQNSLRASSFSVMDSIKAQVDRACGTGVVSCADILAIAARDSVVEIGGPSYSVPVGRRDATTASEDAANRDLPSPFEDLDVLLEKFSRKGFTPRELVALSGAHTVGLAQCRAFRSRIYKTPSADIDPAFAAARQANCPSVVGQGEGNLAPLDPQSPNRFGNNYFQALINRRGLLRSDQALFNGSSTDAFVTEYSNDAGAFSRDFANAMVKMGNLGLPLVASQGEIRLNCGRVN